MSEENYYYVLNRVKIYKNGNMNMETLMIGESLFDLSEEYEFVKEKYESNPLTAKVVSLDTLCFKAYQPSSITMVQVVCYEGKILPLEREPVSDRLHDILM